MQIFKTNINISRYGITWYGYSLRQIIFLWLRYIRSPYFRKVYSGIYIEDCRYKILKVVKVSPILDDVELEDGSHCSLYHCISFPINKKDTTYA